MNTAKESQILTIIGYVVCWAVEFIREGKEMGKWEGKKYLTIQIYFLSTAACNGFHFKERFVSEWSFTRTTLPL